jgi:MFS family permease
MFLAYLADASSGVSLKPSMSALPGGGTLQSLVNGLGAWALIAALVGLVIGAAAWALGVHSQNFQQSMVGRRAVLVSGLAALLIGAAPTVVNFFWNQGANLH